MSALIITAAFLLGILGVVQYIVIDWMRDKFYSGLWIGRLSLAFMVGVIVLCGVVVFEVTSL